MAEKKHNLNVEFYMTKSGDIEKTGKELADWLRQVADLFESECLPASNVTVTVK